MTTQHTAGGPDSPVERQLGGVASADSVAPTPIHGDNHA